MTQPKVDMLRRWRFLSTFRGIDSHFALRGVRAVLPTVQARKMSKQDLAMHFASLEDTPVYPALASLPESRLSELLAAAVNAQTQSKAAREQRVKDGRAALERLLGPTKPNPLTQELHELRQENARLKRIIKRVHDATKGEDHARP